MAIDVRIPLYLFLSCPFACLNIGNCVRYLFPFICIAFTVVVRIKKFLISCSLGLTKTLSLLVNLGLDGKF